MDDLEIYQDNLTIMAEYAGVNPETRPDIYQHKETTMDEIAKNILVNAAKATSQDVDKTMGLVAGSLTTQQLVQVKTLMRAGVRIDHNTVNSLS